MRGIALGCMFLWAVAAKGHAEGKKPAVVVAPTEARALAAVGCAGQDGAPRQPLDWKRIEAALPATIDGWTLVSRGVEWDRKGVQTSVALAFVETGAAGRRLVLRLRDEGPWHPAPLLGTGVEVDDRRVVKTVDWGCSDGRTTNVLSVIRTRLVEGQRTEEVGDARPVFMFLPFVLDVEMTRARRPEDGFSLAARVDAAALKELVAGR